MTQEKQKTHFGLIGSANILVSSGGENFDPESILEQEETNIEISTTELIVILKLQYELELVGLMSEISITKNLIKLTMQSVKTIALNLSQLFSVRKNVVVKELVVYSNNEIWKYDVGNFKISAISIMCDKDKAEIQLSLSCSHN